MSDLPRPSKQAALPAARFLVSRGLWGRCRFAGALHPDHCIGAAIGKLNADPHARLRCRGRAHRLAIAVTHQGETAVQHRLVGKCLQQLVRSRQRLAVPVQPGLKIAPGLARQADDGFTISDNLLLQGLTLRRAATRSNRLRLAAVAAFSDWPSLPEAASKRCRASASRSSGRGRPLPAAVTRVRRSSMARDTARCWRAPISAT